MKIVNKFWEVIKDTKLYKITPYYIVHAIVSLLITLVFLLPYLTQYLVPYTGAVFYLGRELAQYEDKKYFDWKGLIYPIIVSTIVLLLIS